MRRSGARLRNVRAGLDKAYSQVPLVGIEIKDAKFVFFSDHHRGIGDGADDFVQCRETYRAALNHYAERGHTLGVIGDVEELWENSPGPVVSANQQTLQLERRFHIRDRYWRIFGNHDEDWRFPDIVEKHLTRLFKELTVLEGLRVSVREAGTELGEIFVVHGHQGTTFSDMLGWLSRIISRYVWRPIQRLTKIKVTTPATDWRLRHLNDLAMYEWAADKTGLVLLAGHTHHPVFPSEERISEIVQELEAERLRSVDPDRIAELEAELDIARSQQKPVYFNMGCCSYRDGTITGVEIAWGEIRLVRWGIREGSPKVDILASADLKDVLDQLN